MPGLFRQVYRSAQGLNDLPIEIVDRFRWQARLNYSDIPIAAAMGIIQPADLDSSNEGRNVIVDPVKQIPLKRLSIHGCSRHSRRPSCHALMREWDEIGVVSGQINKTRSCHDDDRHAGHEKMGKKRARQITRPQ